MVMKGLALGCLAGMCVKFQACIHMPKLCVWGDFSMCVKLEACFADADSILTDMLGSLVLSHPTEKCRDVVFETGFVVA